MKFVPYLLLVFLVDCHLVHLQRPDGVLCSVKTPSLDVQAVHELLYAHTRRRVQVICSVLAPWERNQECVVRGT